MVAVAGCSRDRGGPPGGGCPVSLGGAAGDHASRNKVPSRRLTRNWVDDAETSTPKCLSCCQNDHQRAVTLRRGRKCTVRDDVAGHPLATEAALRAPLMALHPDLPRYEGPVADQRDHHGAKARA